MLDWIQNTAYATWVRESWGWPFALTLHAFGNAIVVGLSLIIFLRILGLFRTIPYTSLNKLVPIMWIGVAIQVYSGFTLWSSKPMKYLGDGLFQWKFSLVVLGVIVTWYFQNTLNRETANWTAAGTVTSKGVKIVAATALVWSAVLVAGRLTAYLGQLYHA
ncbi:MAG TPA: hypothetical protein VHT51_02185 [Micropepsaceae bacterium]|jgi:hypothetical protein|nr:hypothetical protein [Micropepsaceae bacterium]